MKTASPRASTARVRMLASRRTTSSSCTAGGGPHCKKWRTRSERELILELEPMLELMLGFRWRCSTCLDEDWEDEEARDAAPPLARTLAMHFSCKRALAARHGRLPTAGEGASE